MPYYEPTILERHTFGALSLLRLYTPELARTARPGQAVMVRCAPAGNSDPLLRRSLFLAGANPSEGSVDLLISPEERGLVWLATQPVTAQLDLYGPIGSGFTLDQRTHNLLLAGAGPALPALLFMARSAATRHCAVMLLAAAPPELLPPPYLLPPAIEYQTAHSSDELLTLLSSTTHQALATPSTTPITWADQIYLALTSDMVPAAGTAVRHGRLRWKPGFASTLLAGPMPCGFGSCLACTVETRDGLRLRCKDGPIFDLRSLV